MTRITIKRLCALLVAVPMLACCGNNFTPGKTPGQDETEETDDKVEAPKPGNASGSYVLISEGTAVTDQNGSVASGVSKYEISVYSPDGKLKHVFYAVNKQKLTMSSLGGKYKITSYPGKAGQMDNGYVIDYGAYGKFSGGSYFTDESGTLRYITGGNVHIFVTEDKEGNPLYSFRANGLSTITESGEQAITNLKVDYIKEIRLGGKVLTDQKIKSKKLYSGKETEMQYSVYLPESWDGTKEFPVIYMLHGMENQGPANNKWNTDGKFSTKLAAAIALGSAPECVVIFPNCTVGTDNYFYLNGFVAGANYMNYFFEELVPTVEEKYCIKDQRESRMIGGLSMGGFGSLYYGALHPEMFCYVYACSPAVGVWGSGPDLQAMYRANNKAGVSPGLTIEIGTEDSLYGSAYSFSQNLKKDGVEHVFISRPGAHTWPFWADCADKIIVRANQLFK